MISIVETFFGTWTNYGPVTKKVSLTLDDSESVPVDYINRNNLIIRDDGIDVFGKEYVDGWEDVRDWMSQIDKSLF